MQVRRLRFFVAGKDILASLRPFPWFYEVVRLASKSNGPGQQFLEEAIPVRVPCACPASVLYRGFTSAVGGSLEQDHSVPSQALPQHMFLQILGTFPATHPLRRRDQLLSTR
ncbi:unnamed protein product [Symbiodinium sp. CCMP2456]|nr:unnamed protein product [Symbiodinium sp. CCMP2456]